MKIISYSVFLAFLMKAISLDIFYVSRGLSEDLPSEGKYASLNSALQASTFRESLIILEPGSLHTLKNDFNISSPLSIATNTQAPSGLDLEKSENLAEILIISGSIRAEPVFGINIKISFTNLILQVGIQFPTCYWISVLNGASIYLEVREK